MYKKVSLFLWVFIFSKMAFSEDQRKIEEVRSLQAKLEQSVQQFNGKVVERHEEAKKKSIAMGGGEQTKLQLQIQEEIELFRLEMRDFLAQLEEIKFNIKKIAKGDNSLVFLTPEERAVAIAVKAQGGKDNSRNEIEAQSAYTDAMKMMRAKKLKPAQKDFEKLIKEYPQTVFAVNSIVRIGEILNQLGKFSDAIEHFDRAMQTNLDTEIYTDAILGKAHALIIKGDRAIACAGLIEYNKENLPITPAQNSRLQELLVEGNCASKMDKDRRQS